MNTKKVFIYGASGFIGSSLKKILKDKKLSILNYKKIQKQLTMIKIIISNFGNILLKTVK